MDVFALFSDGSMEKIIISAIGSKSDEKGLVLRSTIRNKELKESAEHAVLNTYNYLLIKYPENKLLLSNISICILGFSEQVVGNSADLAFSLAFIAYLLKSGILKSETELENCIAATGTMNDRLHVGGIGNLRSKMAAVDVKGINTVFFPRDNVPEMDNVKTAALLYPVGTLDEVLEKLGITHNLNSFENKSDSKRTEKKGPQRGFSKRTKFLIFTVVLIAAIVLSVYEIGRLKSIQDADVNSNSVDDVNAVQNSKEPVFVIPFLPSENKDPVVAGESSPPTESTDPANGDNNAATDISKSEDSVIAGESSHVSSGNISWRKVKIGGNGVISDVAYGNGVFVAVGKSTIITSKDGENWTEIKLKNFFSEIQRIHKVNNEFYALCADGSMLTSKDGYDWKLIKTDTNWNMVGIEYSWNNYVSVGGYGSVMSSSDGVTWKLGPRLSEGFLADVAWGNDKFITIDYLGTVFESADGKSWKKTTSVSGSQIEHIKFFDGRFVAVGSQGCIRSKDGRTWEAIDDLSIGECIHDILKTVDGYLAVGSNGTLMTSKDGDNWTGTVVDDSNFFFSAAYGNGTFVVVGTVPNTTEKLVWVGKVE